MSGAKYFDDNQAINPFMDASVAIDRNKASAEHDAIHHALQTAGIEVVTVWPPRDCQDGVYTANWALVINDVSIMSRLPNARKAEEAYAREVLENLGKTIIEIPDNLRFSGQGDALRCGNYLFCGSDYRTDREVHDFLASSLPLLEVVGLKTVPLLDSNGQPVLNRYSGWPDSIFYDLDLALAVINDELIAWCPEAFTPESQERIRAIEYLDKIEVTYKEATERFALNLVSTGETVIMNEGAVGFQAELQKRGLKTITLSNPELAKGGGSIRCTTLTL